MPSFSQRKGLIPLEKSIQHESIDNETRNQLWSMFRKTIFDSYRRPDILGNVPMYFHEVVGLVESIWAWFFKEPSDEIRSIDHGIERIKRTIISGPWNSVLDLTEFITQRWDKTPGLVDTVNSLFIRESCGYRFVNDEICEITDENEISSIVEATQSDDAVGTHLSQALKHLTNREHPDYRNSIKESISAVEALCRHITGNPKATLGDALKVVRSSITMQPTFEKAISTLYGFTSDQGGIRHSLTDTSVTVGFDDAKYFIVICSGFVNYLKAVR